MIFLLTYLLWYLITRSITGYILWNELPRNRSKSCSNYIELRRKIDTIINEFCIGLMPISGDVLFITMAFNNLWEKLINYITAFIERNLWDSENN